MNRSPDQTPDRPHLPRRPRRVPLGLLGLLVLIVIGESGINRHRDALISPYALNRRLAGSHASREAIGCEVLCFGDSQVTMDVSPRILEARSGRTAYNLGVVGGPPSSAYFLLRRALDAGAHPTAIIVGSAANILACDLGAHLRELPDEVLTPRDALDVARSLHDASLFAFVTSVQIFPSVRCRSGLRMAVETVLSGRRFRGADDNNAFQRNWTVNRGALICGSRRWTELTANDRSATLPDGWRPNAANSSYLLRFFRLAAERKIPVYWLLPPISPELQQERQARGLDSRFTRWVEKVRVLHPEVVVLDARRSGYGHDVFMEPAHLDHRGAAALSAAVGDVVREGTAGRTWIRLPSYRPVAFELEDFEESKRWIELPAYRRRVLAGPVEDEQESLRFVRTNLPTSTVRR